MKIGELARRCGMTAHTIRYYERIGLLPYAHRDGGQQREYDASILVWIEFLDRLKTTGMPIRDMLRYAKLRGTGDATNRERRLLLEEHRAAVAARITSLRESLSALDAKIAGYGEAERRLSSHAPSNPSETGRPLRARTARAR
ncbi:MAG: MerR family transcriptional regulator [Hyphomicrobiales bacterium]|nr:MAG: MerR family transcriptional regulator [Hyphomicrobiales bacterium]